MKVRAAIHHGPSSAGIGRHFAVFAPFRHRHTIASTVRRRFEGGTFARGRQASTRGASAAHCASVSTMPHTSAEQAEVGTTLLRR